MDNKANAPVSRFSEQYLLSQNEMLKSQLINSALINELVKVLHSCTDLEGIVKTILLSFQDLVEFDRAVLFTINAEKFCLQPSHWVGIDDGTAKALTVPLGFDGGDITDAIFLNKHIFVDEPDPSNDIFGRELQSRSYIVVPLLRKLTRKCWEIRGCEKKSCRCYGSANPYCWSAPNSCSDSPNPSEDDMRKQCVACPAFNTNGVFWLDRKSDDTPITSNDITFLTNIITLAGLVIENFSMMKALDEANHGLTNSNEELRKVNYELEIAQAKIRLDLEHARTIQQKLLPQDIRIYTQHYDISSRYLAANTVGGDYYDLFGISDSAYGVIVADVSGHGIASALIMSMFKILLKIYSKDETSPQKTLERINELFISEIPTEHFVTVFYAVFDVNTRKIWYSSAGHCPILYLHKKSKQCDMLKADGLFLGVFPDMLLSESSFDYAHGEHRLVLYTDGLTEAVSKNAEMYGMARLVEVAKETIDLSPDDAVEAILAHQKGFCGGRWQEDDITLLVVDFK
ncbi:MAG: serine/threonine-protein phosphatase [Chitinispirillales bacterium]|jgi:serine phosphatase RsbU (regulator of sigma subunit)|nr:serine/threonine-protein phosphatase [Chitinispirillales bacterium]